jgi:hypothetical protein
MTTSNTIQQRENIGEIRPKDVGGAPKANRNARKHGFHSAKAALSEFGQRAIDGRSALGRALGEWREQIVADLGGSDNLSAQQQTVIDVIVRTKLLLDGVDAFILQTGIVNKRRKAVHPVVRERIALAESLVRHLQLLGLKRVQATLPDLRDYLKQQADAKASVSKDAQEPTSQEISASLEETTS